MAKILSCALCYFLQFFRITLLHLHYILVSTGAQLQFSLVTALLNLSLHFNGCWKNPCSINLLTGLVLFLLCCHPPLAPTYQHFADCQGCDRRKGWEITHLAVYASDIKCAHKFRIFEVVLSQWFRRGHKRGREPSTEADLVSPPSSCLCCLQLQRSLSLLTLLILFFAVLFKLWKYF